jgi:hypothetical protein
LPETTTRRGRLYVGATIQVQTVDKTYRPIPAFHSRQDRWNLMDWPQLRNSLQSLTAFKLDELPI